MKTDQIGQLFSENGYIKLTAFFAPSAVSDFKQVAQVFHQAWCEDNREFYTSRAINSSGLTSGQYLTEEQKLILFKLICDNQLLAAVKHVIPEPLFMGTQLFFDPVDPQQKNYWHRDPQYHLSVKEQQAALAGPEVLHVRIPLTSDPGVELIPGSHRHWDTQEELQVRLEQDGHNHSENLSNGLAIPLQVGDILFFSANMIHRGRYGNNRLALDILYCEKASQLVEFIQPQHQPSAAMLSNLDNSLFL